MGGEFLHVMAAGSIDSYKKIVWAERTEVPPHKMRKGFSQKRCDTFRSCYMSPTSKKVYPSSALSTRPPPTSANYVNNLKENVRALIVCPFVGRGVIIGQRYFKG